MPRKKRPKKAASQSSNATNQANPKPIQTSNETDKYNQFYLEDLYYNDEEFSDLVLDLDLEQFEISPTSDILDGFIENVDENRTLKIDLAGDPESKDYENIEGRVVDLNEGVRAYEFWFLLLFWVALGGGVFMVWYILINKIEE